MIDTELQEALPSIAPKIIFGRPTHTDWSNCCNLPFSTVIEQFSWDVRDGLRVSSRGRPYAQNGHHPFQAACAWVRQYEAVAGITDAGEINDRWVNAFLCFLYDNPISLNSISGIITSIHAVSNALIASQVPLKQLTLRVWPEITYAVYNNEDELELLANAEFSHDALNLIRDVFLIQSYTGFRIGTLKRFLKKPEHYLFHQEKRWFIRIKTNKTGVEVVVPVKRFVYRILKRRKFTFPPVYHEYYYNELIKGMAAEAGFTEEIAYTRTIGRNLVSFIERKCDMMSSHTARRNFATNAFPAGVLVEQIMMITGHRTREAFLRYIRADSLANALSVSKLKFFK